MKIVLVEVEGYPEHLRVSWHTKERSVDLWLCVNMPGLLGFSRIQRFTPRDPGCCCRVAFCASLHLGCSGFAAVTPSQKVFAYGSTDAEFPATVSEQPIKDAVITVPAYFNQAERRAVLHAARMADLKVLQLINDNTAVALNYGVFRRKDINATAQVGAFGRCRESWQVACMQGKKCCRKNPDNFKWTLLIKQSPPFSCVHQQDKEIERCVHVWWSLKAAGVRAGPGSSHFVHLYSFLAHQLGKITAVITWSIEHWLRSTWFSWGWRKSKTKDFELWNRLEVFWSPSVKHDPEHRLCLLTIWVLPLGYKVSPGSGYLWLVSH